VTATTRPMGASCSSSRLKSRPNSAPSRGRAAGGPHPDARHPPKAEGAHVPTLHLTETAISTPEQFVAALTDLA
jgi:hypothetical protein